MTLNPMTAEELIATTSAQSEQDDHLSELSTEVILENLILFIVSHFCVGTEMHFVAKMTPSIATTLHEA